MGIKEFFGFGKKTESAVGAMVIPTTLIGGRKGHTGQFTKAVEARRKASRLARLSRRRNRKSRFKKHTY